MIKEELIKKYTLDEQKFNEYYTNTLSILKIGKRSVNKNIIVIVGGQSGAGKSRLIPITKKQLKNNAVVVDFDDLRSQHPYYGEVNERHPELAHIILHPDVEKVKNRILENLRKEKYNVIYEGALRDTNGFIKIANDFKKSDYEIKMNILAVPELESLGSVFLRYAIQVLLNENARWVEKVAHDESYMGVIKTVNIFEFQKLSSDIKVYVRGKNKPIKIYPTRRRKFANSIDAIKFGRESNRKKAVKDFFIKFKTTEEIFKEKKPELLFKLEEWLELYNKEKKDINL